MSPSSHPLAVAILAGGRGERFWPLSTPDTPKQFLVLGGAGGACSEPGTEPGQGAWPEPGHERHRGATLLQQAAQRAEGLAPWAARMVVAGRAHAALVRAQLPALPQANLILEPAGRDTAGAIALACAWALRRTPARGGRLLVMPADHAVPDAAAFRAAVQIGLRVVDAHPHALVTLGIEPTRPETGYGYIQTGEPVASVPGASWARRFAEKPDGATAERFLREGGYRWNSGIFLWDVAAIREALQQYLPGHGALVDRLAALESGAWPAVLDAEFLRLPKISVDYGVMEKASAGLGPGAPRVAVVAAAFAWDDLGGWNALPRLAPADGRGNVVRGPARLVDVEDCIVVSSGRPIGALGVRGLVMVEGPGGVLVCPRERAQEVRRLADAGEVDR